MSHERILTAGLAAIALLAAGCGASDDAPPVADAGTPIVRPVTPAPRQAVTRDRFEAGLPPSPRAAPAPPSPGSLGALSTASIPAIVGVHNVAAAAGRRTGLPRGAVRGQALDVRAALSRLRARLRRPASGTRAQLAAVLTGYARIAARLGRRQDPLATSERRRIAALDARWLGLLRGLDRRSGSRLAAAVPTLPPAYVPAPPPGAQGAR